MVIPPSSSRISRLSSRKSIDINCFVCNKTSDPKLSYNDGGIGRCSEDSSQKKIRDSKAKWLSDSNSQYNNAAKRLNIALIGCDDDVYAAGVYYHKQCYNHFTSILRYDIPINNEEFPVEEQVVSLFLRNVETKILKDHDAYLLNELCSDCKEISGEHGLDESPACIRYTYRIKETLNKQGRMKRQKAATVFIWDI